MTSGLSGSLKFVKMTTEGLLFRAVLKSAAPAFAELLVERKGEGQTAKPAIEVIELAKNAKGESAKKKGNGSVQVLLKGDPKREHLAVVWEIDIVTASGGTGDLIFSARLGKDPFTEIARSPVGLDGQKFNTGSPAAAPLPVRAGTELSIISTYDMPWDGNLKAEITAANDKKWHPGTVSFTTVANTPNAGKKRTELRNVDTFGSMLGALLFLDANLTKERPDNSLTRVNIFAHGNPGLIGLSGFLENDVIKMRTPTTDDNGLPFGGGIDARVVVALNEEPGGRQFRDSVRRKFTEQGEILLFLCNGGLGTGASLAIDLSLCFNVRVLGYSEPIGYYVVFPGGKSADRNLTSIGLVPEGQFESARASGRIKPGYPFAIQAPATVPRGDHVTPDKTFVKPKNPAK